MYRVLRILHNIADFEKDSKILLVKLDFERNKLLIWGNSVGILNEPNENLLAALERGKGTYQKSKALLECIPSLLNDAENLQNGYGVRNYEAGDKKKMSLSVVSKDNMNLFRPTSMRFLYRNPKEAETRKQRAWSKFRWAIFDKQKFQALINDLKDLVDQLFMIPFNHAVPVDAKRLDRSMRMDIELVDSIPQLSLVQEACEDSYRAWSEHAASIIEASEIGTIDRRNIEELSRDLTWGDVDLRASEISTSKHINRPTSAFSAVCGSNEKLYFILTGQCSLMRESKLCDPAAALGSSKSNEYIIYCPPKNYSINWSNGASPADALKPEILKTITSNLHDGYSIEKERLRELLAQSSSDLDETQKELIETYLPLFTLHIYCAPCACLISTAVQMCTEVNSRLVKAVVRPDSRLRSSCCSEESGLKRLQEISERIRRAQGFEPFLSAEERRWMCTENDGDDYEEFSYIDHCWLENLVFYCQEEESEGTANLELRTRFKLDESDSASDLVLVLVLGEADILAPEMLKPPFSTMPRVPKQTEIFKMNERSPNNTQEQQWGWKFAGRFSPRLMRPLAGSTPTRTTPGAPQTLASTFSGHSFRRNSHSFQQVVH